MKKYEVGKTYETVHGEQLVFKGATLGAIFFEPVGDYQAYARVKEIKPGGYPEEFLGCIPFSDDMDFEEVLAPKVKVNTIKNKKIMKKYEVGKTYEVNPGIFLVFRGQLTGSIFFEATTKGHGFMVVQSDEEGPRKPFIGCISFPTHMVFDEVLAPKVKVKVKAPIEIVKGIIINPSNRSIQGGRLSSLMEFDIHEDLEDQSPPEIRAALFVAYEYEGDYDQALENCSSILELIDNAEDYFKDSPIQDWECELLSNIMNQSTLGNIPINAEIETAFLGHSLHYLYHVAWSWVDDSYIDEFSLYTNIQGLHEILNFDI